MGILRSDRVSGLGGANAINGSVKFGNPAANMTAYDSIVTEPSSDYTMGTGDFTLEGWFYLNSVTPNWQVLIGDTYYGNTGGWAFYANANQLNFWKGGGSVVSGGTLTANTWHHIAYSRESGSNKIFVDGALAATASDSTNYIDNEISVGASNVDLAGVLGSYGLNGYASNVRVTKGTALYTAAFTPPTTRLEKRSDTVLLCCQSPGNVEQEATGKIIIARGNAAASHFAPDLGEDYGTTFADNTKFDTLSYMVPPGGRTDQRGRGRGIFGGGYTSSPSGAAVKRIYYVQIQSMGTSAEFGDTNKAAAWGQGGCSSSTRGLFTGGTTPTNLQDIDYITIATTSNGLDFGNLRIQHGYTSSCSNETRGLTGGGRGGSPVATIQEIDYVTIATTGNGQDFGDLTGSRMALGAFESSTRGYFSGGDNSPTSPATVYKNIDTVLFATLGSTSDFGDMTDEHDYHGTCSSSTRGIMYGGNTSYGPTVITDIIEYVTTSSTGSGTDFGDVRDDGPHAHGTSNSIRGVFAGGTSPYRNSIDFITIATTGNGQDWGDLPISSGSYAYSTACSDSHGGLS